MGGGDVLVGVGFHPDGDPHHDVLNHAGRAGDGVEAVDLGDRVQDDVTDPGVDGGGEFVDGFVVAVQGNPSGGKTRVQGDGQFAATGDVEAQTLLGDPPGDLTAQERLRGVVDVFVDDEKRCAVIAGQCGHRNTGDSDHPVDVANEVARPYPR